MYRGTYIYVLANSVFPIMLIAPLHSNIGEGQPYKSVRNFVLPGMSADYM